MTYDFFDLAMLALPLSLFCQWWWMRKRWLSRVQAAQARHARYQARAEMLIAIIKQRMTSLHQQLTGVSQKNARHADAAMLAAAQRLDPGEFELIVVDEDGSSAPLDALLKGRPGSPGSSPRRERS